MLRVVHVWTLSTRLPEALARKYLQAATARSSHLGSEYNEKRAITPIIPSSMVLWLWNDSVLLYNRRAYKRLSIASNIPPWRNLCIQRTCTWWTIYFSPNKVHFTIFLTVFIVQCITLPPGKFIMISRGADSINIQIRKKMYSSNSSGGSIYEVWCELVVCARGWWLFAGWEKRVANFQP